MRFLVPVLAVLVVAVVSMSSVAHSSRPAASAAEQADGGPGTTLSSGGRIGDGTLKTDPNWFGSRWWKKFLRGMKRFLDFIDALIDDLRGQPGDEPSGRLAVIENPGRPALSPIVAEHLRA